MARSKFVQPLTVTFASFVLFLHIGAISEKGKNRGWCLDDRKPNLPYFRIIVDRVVPNGSSKIDVVRLDNSRSADSRRVEQERFNLVHARHYDWKEFFSAVGSCHPAS